MSSKRGKQIEKKRERERGREREKRGQRKERKLIHREIDK